MSGKRIDEAIGEARSRGVALLDAQLMLARLCATTRTGVIAHGDSALDPEAERSWSGWLERRAGGEPLAYLLGEKEFHGLTLEVTPGVLVPRPETELLVDWALELLAGSGAAPRVLDLGTGSGAIALAIRRGHPRARVVASDASLAALAVARRNAVRLGLAIDLVAASWWDGLEGGRFDLVVANPPYVADADPALAALRHEPRAALASGGDGLDAIRAIVAGAPAQLNAGGWLLLEHGFEQADAVAGLLGTAGLERVQTRTDLAGLARATGARRSPAAP